MIEAHEADAGIAMMNETQPGWHRLINLKTLNIRSGDDCVACQVRGRSTYTKAMADMRSAVPGLKGYYGERYGFALPNRLLACFGAKPEEQDAWWADADRRWRAEVERLNALDAAQK